MKYLKLFEDINLSEDLLEVKDIFQEYADKWNLSYHEYQGHALTNNTPVDCYQIYFPNYKGSPKDGTEINIFITLNEETDISELNKDLIELSKRLKTIGYKIQGRFLLDESIPGVRKTAYGFYYTRIDLLTESIKESVDNITQEDLLEIKDIFQEYADKWVLTYHENDGPTDFRTPMNSYQVFIIDYSTQNSDNPSNDFSDEVNVFLKINDDINSDEFSEDVENFCERVESIGYNVRCGGFLYHKSNISIYTATNYFTRRIEISID